MSLKRLQRVFGSAFAGILLGWSLPALCAELPPAKQVEHSNPFESEEEARELTQPRPENKTESLKTQTFAPRGSLGGLPAPILPGPNRSITPAPDRKKDWVFAEPESLLENPRKQDGLGTAGADKENENLSPMERYYLKFITPARAATKTEEGTASGRNSAEKEALLPQGLRATEAFLEEITQEARQSSLGGARLESGDFLGGNNSSLLGPELTPAQKFRQESFRQLLQESFVLPNTVPTINPDLGFAPTADAIKSDFSAQTDSRLSGSSLLRAPETQLGVVPPLSSLMEINARALTPQTPLLQSPAMQQQSIPFKPPSPVNSGPPRPTFSAPRRPI